MQGLLFLMAFVTILCGIYRCYLTCHVNHFNEQLTKINMVDDRSGRNIASSL